jgi:uncharacterized protein YcbK (DUF882 family)
MKWEPSETPNFTADEMRCQCGCGKADMDHAFMLKLQAVRDVVGPLVVSSGYRCPEHNAAVSSTGLNGPHVTGKAADLRCFGKQAHEVLVQAMFHYFTGIGVSQKGPHGFRFIHLDMLQDGENGARRSWTWSY